MLQVSTSPPALPNAGRLLAEIEQAANVGIWEWDPREPHAWWSPQLYRIYGLDPAKHTPSYEDYLTRVHPDDRERVKRATEGVFRDFRSYSHDERVFRPDGSLRYLHTWAHAVVKDGKLERLVGVCQDTTDFRTLRESAESKGEFLRTVGHELATPLTPLKVQARLLADGKLGPLTADQGRSVAILARNLDRMTHLVADMQEVARIQSGRLDLRKEPFALHGAIREAVDLFAATAAERRITLDAGADAGIEVTADRRRIVHALVNYVSNALKFTPPGGAVHVTTTRQDGHAVVAVRDTGPGMRPDQVGHLFRLFSRVHDPAQDVPGSGLGLYIVRGILQQHGGKAWCESDGPGKGSTFFLSVPVDAT